MRRESVVVNSNNIFSAVAAILRDRDANGDQVTSTAAESLAFAMAGAAAVCSVPAPVPAISHVSPDNIAVTQFDALRMAEAASRKFSKSFEAVDQPSPACVAVATEPSPSGCKVSNDFKWPDDFYRTFPLCMKTPAGRRRLWLHLKDTGAWPPHERVEFEATVLYCLRNARNPGAALTQCIRMGHHGKQARYRKEDFEEASRTIPVDTAEDEGDEFTPMTVSEVMEAKAAKFNKHFPVGSFIVHDGSVREITRPCEVVYIELKPFCIVQLDNRESFTLATLGLEPRREFVNS